MQKKVYGLSDVVEMKKPHACQTNRWTILRMGMDIRIKCDKCGQMILMPRNEFNKKMKKVLVKNAAVHTQEQTVVSE